MSVPLATLTGLQWVIWLSVLNNIAAATHLVPWAVHLTGGSSWPASRCSSPPPGRMGGIAVLGARTLLSNLAPGTYRRGGSEHLRVWFAERLADASGAENQAGAPMAGVLRTRPG